MTLPSEGPWFERELAMFKGQRTGEKRVVALRLADIFRAMSLTAALEIVRFRDTRRPRRKIECFAELMRPLGLGICRADRCRSAVSRGN